MMHFRIICCTLIGAVMISAAAFAEEETTKAWNDEAELSFVNTAGNSETTALSGKNKLSLRFAELIEMEWRVAALKNEDDGKTTAERYSISHSTPPFSKMRHFSLGFNII